MLKAQPKVKQIRNLKYLAWLRNQPCQICGVGSYYNSIHAHHTTGGGVSMKGDDTMCVSLCSPCHRQLHDKMSKRGPWSEDDLRTITSDLMDKYLRTKTGV